MSVCNYFFNNLTSHLSKAGEGSNVLMLSIHSLKVIYMLSAILFKFKRLLGVTNFMCEKVVLQRTITGDISGTTESDSAGTNEGAISGATELASTGNTEGAFSGATEIASTGNTESAFSGATELASTGNTEGAFSGATELASTGNTEGAFSGATQLASTENTECLFYTTGCSALLIVYSSQQLLLTLPFSVRQPEGGGWLGESN